MAQSAMYAHQQLNHGTLMPGQTIYVNQYAVQVERYLSQGGYAHVYLVRTPSPVFGTTRHVLKRIAVANEALLSEVKKEVDIMRILRGHPSIVYFIDAAWNMLPNGTYEVFILMEFCAGGGIIDMMNRRLRERLTEAEILQVFVDVCEAVAAMHNLRPPLLHRDLKVENILQSSETSFKLCDFGSAAPISKPPTTSQEHRRLEADLNRHTTLQYRAPEMVDLYLRRPIDEKSDVWALGVLLYKLCYYTTPFEEHGVLAILNVQYKTPPFPVYSTQMNELIGSMLKELGVQRSSVFEVLDRVHKMRGTKSKFTYIQPSRQSLAPRIAPSEANPLDGVVAYKPSSMPISVTNNGLQSREKAREVVSPPRKERKQIGSPGRLPLKGLPDDAILSSSKREDDTWKSLKPARVHKSGVVPSVAIDVWKSTKAVPVVDNNPWSVKPHGRTMETSKEAVNSPVGFGESFNDLLSVPPVMDNPSSGRLSSSPSNDNKSRTPLTSATRQDAFESLNVFPSKGNAPTLGQQKSGLSTQSRTPALQADNKYMTTPSPRPSTSTSWKSTSSPILNTSAPSTYDRTANDSFSAAEQRFPSLEELDSDYFPSFQSTSLPTPSRIGTSTITPTINNPPTQDPAAPRLPPRPKANAIQTERPSQLRPTRSSFTGGLISSALATPSLAPTGSTRTEGVRSQHVTGVAMREAKGQPIETPSPLSTSPSLKPDGRVNNTREQSSPPVIKTPGKAAIDVAASSYTNEKPPAPQDWLTGNDSMAVDTLTPVLRASPEKRSSTILQQSHVAPVVPIWEQLQTSSALTKDKVTNSLDESQLLSPLSLPKEQGRQIPIYSTTRTAQRQRGRKSISSSSESADTEEGPEDAISSVRHQTLRRETTSTSDTTPKASRVKNIVDISPGPDASGDENNLRRSHTQIRAPARKGRQSSVHDLVDLWGGGISSSGAAAAFAAAAISNENYSEDVKAESGRRRSVLLSSRIPGPRQGDTQEISGLPSTYTTSPTFISSPATTSTDHKQTLSTKSNNTGTTSFSANTEATTSAITPSTVEITFNSSIPKKARPQSMFASPQIQKASSDRPNLATKLKSPEIAKSKSSFVQSLAPPSLDEVDEEGNDGQYYNRRPSRSSRRSSISNIVSQYEAIGAGVDAVGDAQSPKFTQAKPILNERSGNGNDMLDESLTSSSIRPSSPIRESSSLIKTRSGGVINDTGVGTRIGTSRAATLSGNSATSYESRSIPISQVKPVVESVSPVNESFTAGFNYVQSSSTVAGEAKLANAMKSTVTPYVKPNSAANGISGQIHKSKPSFGGVRVPPLKDITPPREEPSVPSKSSNDTSLNNTEGIVYTRSTLNSSLESQDNSSNAAPRSNQLSTPPVAPTPERAYQGVSRLIDQWQKKSEEAEMNVGPARGRGIGYKGRREGVVNAGGVTGSGIK